MSMSDVYLEGDPATDSARRHMERVLKEQPKARRWPWVLAALGTAGVWFVWRSGRDVAGTGDASSSENTDRPLR